MKAWTIAWKDTLIRFRDRNALFLMLVAPLVMSAIIGAAFGDITAQGAPPITDIPVLIVNQDQGPYGQIFVEALNTPALAGLLDLGLGADLDAALARVEAGEVRAVIHVPPGFSSDLQRLDVGRESAQVALYFDPTAPISTGIVRGIVARVAGGISSARISAWLALEQAAPEATAREMAVTDVEAAVAQAIELAYNRQADTLRIDLTVSESGALPQDPVSSLAFFAPSMAMFFLMFTMFDGARSILVERRAGTLARMLATPTPPTLLLLGKIAGVLLTGVLQFAVLVLASRLVFGLGWGDSPAGLALMVFAVVASLACLGVLVTALARDLRQANILGSAIILVFAAVGGNFYPAASYPAWLQSLSRLTVTRWGLDGFTDLTMRGLGFVDVLPEAAVLLGLATVSLGVAVWRFRQGQFA